MRQSNTLTNWIGDPLVADPCNSTIPWEGIQCAADRITRIEIPNKDLTGTLPECLWDLSELERLDLSGSPLTGDFPHSITSLPRLNSIVLENMELTGTLPNDWCKEASLTRLVVSNNNMTGSLPTSLADCWELDTIGFADNDFQGILPATWATLGSVAKIDVSGNHLTGSLPSSYANLTGLIEFRVKGNSFSGTLPSEYSEWASLVTFDIGGNNLIGPIPASYSQWTQMAYFRVNDNGLSGIVPAELSSTWSLLKEFHLHNTEDDPDAGTNGFCGSNSANMTFASIYIYPEEIRVPNTCEVCCIYEGSTVPPLLCAQYDEDFDVICPGDVGVILKEQLTTLQAQDAGFTAATLANAAAIVALDNRLSAADAALDARLTEAEARLDDHLARLDALTATQDEHVVCMALQTECNAENMALIRSGQEVVQPDPIEWLIIGVGGLAALTILLILGVRLQAFKRIKKVDGKVKGTVPLFSDEEESWKNEGSSSEGSDEEGGKKRRPSEELVERTLHRLQERMVAQEKARRKHMVAVRQRMMAAMTGQPLPPMPSSAKSTKSTVSAGTRRSGASKLRRDSTPSGATKSAAALTGPDAEYDDEYDEDSDEGSEDQSDEEDEDEYSDASSGEGQTSNDGSDNQDASSQGGDEEDEDEVWSD